MTQKIDNVHSKGIAANVTKVDIKYFLNVDEGTGITVIPLSEKFIEEAIEEKARREYPWAHVG